MRPSTVLSRLSPAAAELLTQCEHETVSALWAVVAIVDTADDLTPLRQELNPVSDRVARAALFSAVLSLATALLAALAVHLHRPLVQTLPLAMVALGCLVKAARTARWQRVLDTAQGALLRLPETGPMSRETVQSLCKDVKPVPTFVSSRKDEPLFQAHLALARALAREHRLSHR